jgi:hypothetical protein
MTTILIKKKDTAGAPAAGDLTNAAGGAEIAVNTATKRIYTKDSGGNVVEVGTNPTATTMNGNLTFVPDATYDIGASGATRPRNLFLSGAATLGTALTVPNGGTGLTTLATGSLSYGAGTSAFSTLAIGTAGQILTSTGTAPQWSTLSGVAVTTFSAGTTGFTPNTATSGAITLAGTLATTNGGTGLTSFTSGGVVYASSTSALATGSALTFNGNIFEVASSDSRFNVTSTGSGQTAGISIKGGAGGGSDYNFIESLNSTGTQQWYLGGNGTGNVLAFKVATAEGMRLTSTGLGIGTNSPQAKLELFSNADANFGIKIYHTSVALATQRFPQVELSHTPIAQGYQNKVFLRQQNSVTYGNYPSFAIITDAAGGGEVTRLFLDGFSGNLDLTTGGAVFTTNRGQYSQQTKFYQETSGGGAQYETTNPTVNAQYYAHVFKGTNNVPTTVEYGRFNQFGIGLGGASPSSGTGITFPATQSASSDANTLDDYEEGTFEPTLSDVSGNAATGYSVRTGFYTKIGNSVTALVNITLTNKGSMSTAIYVLGLPFSTIRGGFQGTGLAQANWSGLSGTLTGGTYGGALYLYNQGSAGQTNLTGANVTNTSQFDISVTYTLS